MNWGAFAGGLVNAVTGGIAGVAQNAVTAISQGRPLDAAAGVIVGLPTQAIMGLAQAGAATLEGITGNPGALNGVMAVNNQLNTFGGATAFAAAAVGAGLVAGGKGGDLLKGIASSGSKAQATASKMKGGSQMAKSQAPVKQSGGGAGLLMLAGLGYLLVA